MSPEPELFNYDRSDHHKHLDFVQGAISRLAGNSFVLKGWALTLSSAIVGLSVTREDAALTLVALIPAIAFWALDAFFLRQERAFRDMYRAVVSKIIPPFEIDPAKFAKLRPLRKAVLSASLIGFYGAITSVVISVFLVLLFAQAPPEEGVTTAAACLLSTGCCA